MTDHTADDNDRLDPLVNQRFRSHSLGQLLQYDRDDRHSRSQSIAYFHSTIDRQHAERLLQHQYSVEQSDGLFLVRHCTTSTHDFSLSLIHQNKCYHYRIRHHHDIVFSIGRQMIVSFVDDKYHFRFRFRSLHYWP
jgi:hypothetical protein